MELPVENIWSNRGNGPVSRISRQAAPPWPRNPPIVAQKADSYVQKREETYLLQFT